MSGDVVGVVVVVEAAAASETERLRAEYMVTAKGKDADEVRRKKLLLLRTFVRNADAIVCQV
jgi:hypothetical protein